MKDLSLALKSGEVTLQHLTDVLGIKTKEYSQENLIVLNYNMFSTPKGDEFGKQCRGVVLDTNTFDYVCRPFDRFFNFGEEDAGVGLDWTKHDISVREKLDGSLVKVFWWNNQWNVATRGTAFAETEVNGWDKTFQEFILDGFGCIDLKEFTEFFNGDKEYTHLFEVTGRENRVVTNYGDKTRLTYLISRHTQSGKYKDCQSDWCSSLLDYRVAKTFPMNTSDEVMQVCNTLPNLEEGFVVYVDGVPSFKFKSPAYIVAHLVRGEGLSEKKVVELILQNEQAEYLSYFPEDSYLFTPYILAKERLLGEAQIAYEKFHSFSKKDMANLIKDHPQKHIVFSMCNYGYNVVEAFDKLLNTSKVAQILNTKKIMENENA